MDYNALTPGLQSFARRFATPAIGVDDLTQVGLIGAWLAHEKRPDASMKYLIASGMNSIRSYMRKERAKKRTPSGGFVSLTGHHPNERPLIERLPQDDIVQLNSNWDSLSDTLEHLEFLYGPDSPQPLHHPQSPAWICRAVTRYIIEEVARIPKDRIPKEVDGAFFREHNLGSFLKLFYQGSPFRAISDAYPGAFAPWEHKRAPSGLWVGEEGAENARAAMQWFVTTHAVNTRQQAAKISRRQLIDAGLGGMLIEQYHDSVHEAILAVFPDIRPWEFGMTPKNYFADPTNQRTALDAFISHHTKASLAQKTPEETYDLRLRGFVKTPKLVAFGLTGLHQRFGSSTWRLFTEHYPVQILPWTIVAREPWKQDPEETGNDAMRWLIESYFALEKETLPQYFRRSLIDNAGFSGVLSNPRVGFRGSTWEVVNRIYPGAFTKQDFARGRKSCVPLSD